MWIQSASNVVGGSRIGFANNSTVTIGSSGLSLFIHDSTHSPVFEFLNNPQTHSNPGFRFNVACAPCCAEDINHNGTVNIDDLVQVITSWGMTTGPADINGDHLVNIDDLVAVITHWGACQ